MAYRRSYLVKRISRVCITNRQQKFSLKINHVGIHFVYLRVKVMTKIQPRPSKLQVNLFIILTGVKMAQKMNRNKYEGHLTGSMCWWGPCEQQDQDSLQWPLTGLKLENYYFFTFTFSRPEVRKLLLFYVFTFSRPEVGKLLLFYVFTFSRPEVGILFRIYVFTFSRPEVGKLFRIYVFIFSRPEVGKLFRIYVFIFSRPQVRKLLHISMA